MPYDKKTKIKTAKILKELRNTTGDSSRKRSHDTLHDEMTEKYKDTYKDEKEKISIPTSKALLKHEIDNPAHKDFQIGYGMRLDTFVLYADFHNVTCDYLLGRQSINDADTKAKLENEFSKSLGLDELSVSILKAIASDKVNNTAISRTLNELIHAMSNDLLSKTTKLPEVENQYIESGFINKLTRYLISELDPQIVEIKTYELSSPFADEFFMSGEELINLFFVDLQNMIAKSREKYTPVRKEVEVKLIKMIKEKQEQERQDD